MQQSQRIAAARRCRGTACRTLLAHAEPGEVSHEIAQNPVHIVFVCRAAYSLWSNAIAADLDTSAESDASAAAASADPNDGRPSSWSRPRQHDDPVVRPVCRPHGLHLGLSLGECT